MVDVSHAGTVMTMQASVTLANVPTPITYTPDDTDPFDAASVTIGSAEMGTNGNVISWSNAAMTEFTIAVIPKSPSHVALATVFNANVVAPGKTPNNDVITFSRVMPDGSTMVLKDCKLTAGTPYMSMASSGRVKTPTYTFRCPPQVEVIVPQL
ncbi:hypothetical protein KKJFFJLC_00003 [Vibrio phage vB_VpaS_PGB]|nr:hypothetical protein HHKILHMN_00033 [Vibrio phage vB_VpaS_PGA]WVH05546.1 hypothetical protein KKJFFJLC_00003 [Vibrio phage vB_VpaS_PGB]